MTNTGSTTWSPSAPSTPQPTPSAIRQPAAPAAAARVANPVRSLALNEIKAGFIMIILGLAITFGTLAMRLPIFVVSWGPVVFGIRRVFRGVKLLAKA